MACGGGWGGVNKNTSFWEDSEADTRTVRVVHTTFRGLTMNTKQEMRQKPDGATGSSVDFVPLAKELEGPGKA